MPREGPACSQITIGQSASMPASIKLVLVLFAAVMAVGICFARPKDNLAARPWLWRGGENDLMRRMLFRADGSFRKHAKLGSAVFFVVFASLVWFAIPTKP
jgi:hypothetical protein